MEDNKDNKDQEQNVLDIKKDDPPKDKKEPLDKDKDKNKEFHFIYFIESHDKTKKIKIYLSPEYKDNDTLESILEKDSTEIRNSLISKIYRFKIFPDNCDKSKKEQEISVFFEEMKDEEPIKSEYTLKIRDIKKDYYDYDLYDEKINIVRLTYEQKFELYVSYLKSKNIKQGTKEKDEFILSTQTLLAGQDKRFDFLFYLLIFLECFSTKLVHRHLFSFKPKKIRGLGKVPKVRLGQMTNILNMLAKKPEKIRVEKEESRKQITELFYFVVLYFNLNFAKEKVNDMLNDDKIFEYVYRKLFDYTNLFEKMIISNELACKLLQKVKEFNEILISLSFLGKNFLNFLIVINKMSDLIIRYIAEEEKKVNEKKIEEKENENENKNDSLNMLNEEDIFKNKSENSFN
jgi:hypothetical protein